MQKQKKSPFEGLEEPIKSLYESVNAYVKANGGSIAVIGGVGIMQEKPGRFIVCISCLGRAPKLEKAVG